MAVLKREQIVKEIETRLWAIQAANGYPITVGDVQRNPNHVTETFPCVNIFEEPDEPVQRSQRGGNDLALKKVMHVDLEFWLSPDEDSLRGASTDLMEFFQCVRWALFNDGVSLGGLGCEVAEGTTSRVYSSAGRGAVIGMGVRLIVHYTETLVSPIV